MVTACEWNKLLLVIPISDYLEMAEGVAFQVEGQHMLKGSCL